MKAGKCKYERGAMKMGECKDEGGGGVMKVGNPMKGENAMTKE